MLKERTRVRHSIVMDSNLEIRLKNIMKTRSVVGGGRAVTIFTMSTNRCNRLRSMNFSVSVIRLLTITLVSG